MIRPREDADFSGRIARVQRVLAAGARVQNPEDALGIQARERLPAAAGLSPEGVALALSSHMETSANEADLRALVLGASRADRCHIVLSANVCTAALRAIAVAVATAPDVRLKPSRRDPVVAELVIAALREDPLFLEQGTIRATATFDVSDIGPEDEVHAYGSDETIAQIRAILPPFARLRGHGTGLGVAVMHSGDPVGPAAEALAAATIVFDQRGCLSPRWVLVEGAADRAISLARELARSLESAGKRVPRGPVDAGLAAEIRRYADTAAALGGAIVGDDFVVGWDDAGEAPLLPPAARVLHVVPVPGDLPTWIRAFADKITAIGVWGEGRRRRSEAPNVQPGASDGALAAALAALVPRSRRSSIDAMQRPPLDGPVDLRTTRGPDPGEKTAP